MRESFLHYIWQFQKFNNANLTTDKGDPIQVISIGQYNTNAGPDFLNAKIVIDDITWYGNVEIHLKSSDWNKHNHQNDEAYNNVILHVVWENDRDIQSQDGNVIPVLVLNDKIEHQLLKRCHELVKSPEDIPCSSQIDKVQTIDILAMTEHAGIQRLEKKSGEILKVLNRNKGSWEETAHQVLFKNFGFKRNGESFYKLSQVLDHKTLIKHSDQIKQLEALLFGVAGFLDEKSEVDYYNLLKQEYLFLGKKYEFLERSMKSVEWKFLRTRPGNFPTIRLAQLAGFYHKNSKFFNALLRRKDPIAIVKMFDFEVSAYWQNHYRFGTPSKTEKHRLGQSSIENVLINTMAPILVAYGKYIDNREFLERAIDITMKLSPENNTITRKWDVLGITAKSAFDSQALVGLHNDFCLKKKCLSCKIGVAIINQ